MPKRIPQRQILKQRSPTFDELPDWCTLREAQQYLRLGFFSISRRLASGELPSRKLGR